MPSNFLKPVQEQLQTRENLKVNEMIELKWKDENIIRIKSKKVIELQQAT